MQLQRYRLQPLHKSNPQDETRHAQQWYKYLLDSHGFSQISREIYIETFPNGEPVGNELQRDHIEQTLKTINRLGDLNLLRLFGREFFVVRIANDNGSTGSGDDY